MRKTPAARTATGRTRTNLRSKQEVYRFNHYQSALNRISFKRPHGAKRISHEDSPLARTNEQTTGSHKDMGKKFFRDKIRESRAHHALNSRKTMINLSPKELLQAWGVSWAQLTRLGSMSRARAGCICARYGSDQSRYRVNKFSCQKTFAGSDQKPRPKRRTSDWACWMTSPPRLMAANAISDEFKILNA